MCANAAPSFARHRSTRGTSSPRERAAGSRPVPSRTLVTNAKRPVAMHAEPGAARGQIAPGEDVAEGRVVAPCGGSGRPRVELVAIGGHHERIAGMRGERDDRRGT